jgi:hypothetical protein
MEGRGENAQTEGRDPYPPMGCFTQPCRSERLCAAPESRAGTRRGRSEGGGQGLRSVLSTSAVVIADEPSGVSGVAEPVIPGPPPRHAEATHVAVHRVECNRDAGSRPATAARGRRRCMPAQGHHASRPARPRTTPSPGHHTPQRPTPQAHQTSAPGTHGERSHHLPRLSRAALRGLNGRVILRPFPDRAQLAGTTTPRSPLVP